ncbi:hypothetical protein Q8W71_17715 [Methylobacterium sp. NEAU 140]|uniref:hypothetical protein n=1 Tax=Methylobacterium sp. NEAU 140 TaxID=3064945 RepID=UPI002733CE16|nr:hypothetical protein [Methylobacterium sp. NEAU 140]MDP4024466.1 hypothetical protein [Methylobacterium sp. NEAU 140]
MVNFPPALKDVALAGQGIASLIADALAAAANSPKAVRVDSALAFTPTEMLQGIANLGLLNTYLAMTPAQQAMFRLNIGAVSNADFAGVARYVAKSTGTIITTGTLAIDEFLDNSGLNTVDSTNATVQGGQLVNQGSDTYAVSLLHLNGFNNGTTFTDVAGKTYTATGAPVISTAQFKFGTASLALDGNSHLTSNVSSDFALTQNGAWTVDFQYRPSDIGTLRTILDFTNGNGAQGLHIFQNGAALSVTNGIASGQSYPNVFTANTWTEVEVVNNGSGGVYVFANGVLLGNAAAQDYGTSNQMTIGYFPNGGLAKAAGWIDEVRVSKGIARHTASYPASTAEFSYGSSGPLDARSIVFPVAAGAQVNKASIVVVYKVLSGTGALTAKASRTGSIADATAFSLQQGPVLGGWTFVKADGLDLSGNPAGASPMYGLTCPASLSVAIDAVEFGYGA